MLTFRINRLVSFVAMVIALGVTTTASTAQAQQGKAWALLVGVEQYENVVPLQFTVNDAQQLGDTLRAYGGFQRANVLVLTDKGSDRQSQPYSTTLKQRLPQWLLQPAAEDTVVVYFSGHGFQDSDGKMYLAPLDFQKDKAAETGLSVDWLRDQIEQCPARFKLLIIDSCHAGSEKDAAEDKTEITADALGEKFKSLEGVVTLASCKAAEKSLIWRDKQSSLYTYWLTEGLKGHADRDSNGRVDIDELHKYVERRVRHTAEVRFPRAQTPVRIIGPSVTGVPTIVDLKPQPLRTLIADMAEHVANIIGEHRLSRVGVLEFMDNTQLQQTLDGQFGLLGKFCGDELQRQLTDLSFDADFRVADRQQLWSALRQQQFELKDISSPMRLVSLAKSVDGMPAIALGTISDRDGRVIRLQCQLKETVSGDAIGITGGTAVLSEDDYGMLGNSVAVRPEDRQPDFVAVAQGETPGPESEQVIERLDERAQGGHALLDPVFKQKFNVQFKIEGEVREGVFQGNDCFVPVSKGETYSLRITNNSGQLALMRLLVDGLDTTLRVPEKGLATELWGQPVTHLDEAGIRFLDPQGEELKGGPPIWEVMGFTTQTGQRGKVRLFEVVDAAESLASRQGFTEQIGLVTVAFYAPAGGTRAALGTAAGEEREREIRTRKGPKPGNLLGVVHLRYVDADALDLVGN